MGAEYVLYGKMDVKYTVFDSECSCSGGFISDSVKLLPEETGVSLDFKFFHITH